MGHQAVVTREPRIIADASHVVLPGVGAFGDCMANLAQYELIDPIRAAIQSGKPFLGICLGLQLLFTESEEFGTHKGLGIIPGRIRKFVVDSALKVPHMGWNEIEIVRAAPPLEGIKTGSHCYFVHSYYVEPADSSVTCSDGIWPSVCLGRVERQYRRLPISSRKEPGYRTSVHQELWCLDVKASYPPVLLVSMVVLLLSGCSGTKSHNEGLIPAGQVSDTHDRSCPV